MPYAPCGISLATKGVLCKKSAEIKNIFEEWQHFPPRRAEQETVRPYVKIKKFEANNENKKKITAKLITDI